MGTVIPFLARRSEYYGHALDLLLREFGEQSDTAKLRQSAHHLALFRAEHRVAGSPLAGLPGARPIGFP